MNYTQRMHQGVAPGRSMANGGSKGSSGPYYGNMDKLYGEQARAAQFMLDQSMPMLPGTMQNTAGMTQDAMSGALGNRMRRQAGIDADAASGDALTTMNQNLAGYGVNPNSGLFAGANRKLAVSSAANKVGAMNQVGQWAEDQKWNRNAGQFAQLSGMGDGAVQGLSSAAGGFGNMAAQQDNKDMANARGYGQMGAALGSALTKKDGGYISVGLANGGDAWAAWKAKNPIAASGRRKSGGNPLGMVVAGAAPSLAAEGLKAAWKGSGAGDAIKGLFARSPVDATVNGGTQAATLAAQDAAVTGASGISEGTASAMLGEQGATLAAQDAAVTGAAGLTEGTTAALGMAEGAGAAGAAGVGSGAMAGLAAAAPWLVGGLAIGHALDLFADGGDVQGRKDMTQGGDVQGPGTETSDSIPAWLSKGEYVINAEAVKLAGKENLEKINDAGLYVRYGNADKREAMVKAASGLRGAGKKGVKLAGGGYLGVALGSGVQQFERQKAAQREDDRFKQQQAMQERQMKMSEAAAARQEAAAQRLIDKENKIEGVQAKAAGYIEDANAIAGFDTGHMTPEEKAAAGRAYSEAGYSPEALRGKAIGVISAQNLVAGMQLNDMLRKQEQDRRRGAVGQAMAGGDIGGAISNAGGDWTQQGFGLSILGTTTDKRTGAKTITIGKDGKPVAAIDASLLGDFTESLIDPSKAPAFSKEQRSLENMYRDDERANKSLAIQGGSAALSNRLNNLKIGEAEQLAAVNAKVRDLRGQLAETKDPAVAEELMRQIRVYEGTKAERDTHRYDLKVVEDMMGNKSFYRFNKVTGEVIPIASQAAQQAATTNGNGKPPILPPPAQTTKSPSFEEYAAQIRAKNPGKPIPDDVLRAEYNKRAGG